MQLDTFDHENLIAGSFPRVTDTGILVTGQVYEKGTILAKISGSGDDGKFTIVDSGGSNMTDEAVAILLDEVDATAADQRAAFWLTGEFNKNKLVTKGTDTPDDFKDQLRSLSIFVKDAQEARPAQAAD